MVIKLTLSSSEGLSSADKHGIDDEIQAVQNYTHAKIKSIQDLNLDENANNHDWEHSKAHHEGEGHEN